MNALELAGGVLITGFSGTHPDAAELAALQRVPFAGYILFARNLEDVVQARELTDILRAQTQPAPIVAIDQEGGRIMRLREGVEPIPPMMALGALGDIQVAFDAGETLAHDLRRIGCTLDFSPVLDLALDRANTVIGTRAFGTPVRLVTELGGAVARGLSFRGITPTFKHFPGHGATSFDTHVGPARLDVDASTLRVRDLAPFAACIRDDAAIMTAHVAVPAIDGDRPASLSRAFLTGILRDAWGFNGVCFTDCMQMDAIARGIGTVRGVTEAIAAGADCALVSHDPQLAFEAAQYLADAVERGEVPRERLQQAYDRVMLLRTRALPPLDLDALAPHPGIGRRIAREAVTVVRGEPRADAAADVAVIFGDRSLAAHAPALEERCVPVDPDDAAVAELVAAVRASHRRPLLLSYRAHLYPRQARAIEAICVHAPDAMIVSTGEPYDVPIFAQARHVLACYGNDSLSLAGLADVIFLGTACHGVLPVEIA
ncbi:MAG TPA: beta-N-acetylhexosaminidase [Verrucomicrobiae bacterium]|nr:beta-N-acetylhexosaminidase [Verrucomicrobiae bacterium]